jgi:hypothetical protein
MLERERERERKRERERERERASERVWREVILLPVAVAVPTKEIKESVLTDNVCPISCEVEACHRAPWIPVIEYCS